MCIVCVASFPLAPFLQTASNQKVNGGKAWEQGYNLCIVTKCETNNVLLALVCPIISGGTTGGGGGRMPHQTTQGSIWSGLGAGAGERHAMLSLVSRPHFSQESGHETAMLT